jgi:hypothetical protein
MVLLRIPVTAVARSPHSVTDRLPLSASPLSSSGWRSHHRLTHSRPAVTASLDPLEAAVTVSFALRVTALGTCERWLQAREMDSPLSSPLSLLPLSYIHLSTTSFNYIFPLIKPWESKDSGLRVYLISLSAAQDPSLALLLFNSSFIGKSC